jgi:glucosamine--fructose-6-phosphate aminotransferase (isomerizing)
MCGIFAYINCNVPRERRHILEVLFNGLRRLEYRGYDSAGISIDADNDNHHHVDVKKGGGQGLPPLVFREEGKIEKLVTSVYQGIW